jgi:nucleoside-diphosphate-sugar epimerase
VSTTAAAAPPLAAAAQEQQQQTIEARPQRQVFVGVTTPLAWAATPPRRRGRRAPRSEPPSPRDAVTPPDAAAPAGSEERGWDGVATGAATAAEAYTEHDAPARQPAACAAACHQAEQAVLRLARPGRLATHVVLPGVLYGAGEDDAGLHCLFRAAWEGGTIVLAGPGTNRIPMLHVDALAAYVAELVAASASALALAARVAAAKGPVARRALQQTLLASGGVAGAAAGAPAGAAATITVGGGLAIEQPPAYAVVADAAPITQAQLVGAIASVFGPRPAPRVERIGSDEGLLLGGAIPDADCKLLDRVRPAQSAGAWQGALALRTIDLPLRSTALPRMPQPLAGRRPGGFLDSLPAVAQEMLDARRLAPIRILVRGAPASGKSHLAARLAARYRLPLVSAKTILAEASHCDSELQKVGRGLT